MEGELGQSHNNIGSLFTVDSLPVFMMKTLSDNLEEIPTCPVIGGKLHDDLTWHDVNSCNVNNT